MKLVFALLFLCVTYSSIAQNKSPEVYSPESTQFIDDLEAYLTSIHTETETMDITSEFWDTSKIKIDYGTEVSYPIHIQFKDTNYVSPIPRNKVITSRYGWRKGRAHKGIDIDLITGDSLYAMFDGVVRFANYSSGHGRTVVVRHFNGLETVYAHLSRYGVKENDTVVAGSYLGKGGTSGNARGSHLHLEMNYKGIPVNPEYLLDFNENNEIRAKDIWITKTWTRPELHSSKRQSKLEIFSTEEEAIASMNREPKVYIVKKGDTLSKISLRNNTSITAICKSNHMKRNSTLRIGQKLIIE
ncbi:peptidoglycan DD-metalloendopeptidase family protein [Xanthomarina gelatinilytica]|jgi:murein DD-endopeptidase MepM/ murein hydrolase activator NlpD|uniref:peptidoglycan DD-metalloendopeptidase family protein n=1 Tax=Xanthomarina gelatinilytica TaxID=1137281 RepID=UPI003AA7F0A4